MKILHVADLHIDYAWFEWIAGHCTEYDLLVIAGDLQNGFSNVGMHAQARAVTKWLLGLSTPTIVASGNHDARVAKPRVVDVYAEAGWIKMLRGKANIIGVDGDLVDFYGLRILVNGWLQRPVKLTEQIDIVVNHAPPMGSACAVNAEGRDFGDPELWSGLGTPPRLLLCGHIHYPSKRGCYWPSIDPTTLVLVPGCDERSETPAHWIIDTETGVAIHSQGGHLKLPT